MTTPVERAKTHDIVFFALPPDQAVQAARALGRLPGVVVQSCSAEHRVSVHYDVMEHTLQELEAQLQQNGFHLDGSILQKIKRAIVYYTEDVQRDNMHMPEHPTKTRDVYVQMWDHHPHGDHDDTPEELRRYL
ncbi:hypothetical protein [Amantichitinum ursilacus]|uniref:Uncharacterized protein n=1 Tax=Amantichitinum ursilacus TaxID=857265 RepID=A0A0N0GMB8_9NEIS|nr:hypothetical protein [Amantichitinum ursilacus]KPC50799.1 hypothetical protein WG78_15925 [Amantichitinum ursilacus]